MRIENIIDSIIKDIDKIETQENIGIKTELIGRNVPAYSDAKDPDFYLKQPPDTSWEGEGELSDHINLLGSYTMMSSPGVIVLYKDNLRNFFWGIVKYLFKYSGLLSIQKNDLKYAADIIVLETFWHEQFHFCCNVFREVFNGQFNSNIEEALAVAYSRLRVEYYRTDQRTRVSKIDRQFFDLFVAKAFDYKSPGYRDWIQYNNQSTFENGLLRYCAIPKEKMLTSNGVGLSSLPVAMINSLLAEEEKGYKVKIHTSRS